MVELGTCCTTERVHVGHSPPTVARACALLDPFYFSGSALISRELLRISVHPCLSSVVLVYPFPSLLGCDLSCPVVP